MTLTMPRRLTKGAVTLFSAAAGAVVAVALLALLVLGGRLVFPLIAASGLLLALAVPSVRRWMAGEEAATRETRHKGLLLPAGVLLHPAHVWARTTPSGAVSVGVDDLLQRALGPVGTVALPLTGRRVQRGEPLFTLSRGHRAVTVAAPVGGRIVEANDLLALQPSLLNEVPYGEGWVARIEPDRPLDDQQHLVGGRRAGAFFRREVDRFLDALRPPSVPAMLQDGGELAGDLHHRIDDLTWERLAAGFFTDRG